MLNISINSFSFKRGIPYDPSGHGGGFVFDCRGLNNPGRLEPYKKQTGNDKPVADFLEANPETTIFIKAVCEVISVNIKTYLERGFEDLTINFGCTGGQHRSVYCANTVAAFIAQTFPEADLTVQHLELSKGF